MKADIYKCSGGIFNARFFRYAGVALALCFGVGMFLYLIGCLK